MFTVNEDRCLEIGKSFNSINLQPKAFHHLAPVLDKGNLAGLILIYVSGICHQTQSLSITIENETLKGWDCLMNRFNHAAKHSPEILDFKHMSIIKPDNLALLLGHNEVPNNSALLPDFNLKKRAEYLRNISVCLHEDYGDDPKNIFEESRYIMSRERGIYSLLNLFDCFKSDPLKKKSTALTMLMLKSGLIFPIRDPENIIPMMDYNKERLLLRTGCIEVSDESIAAALKQRAEVSLDVDQNLREAGIAAYKKILSATNSDFFDLDMKLWGFSRAYCSEPNHSICISGEKPDSKYVHFHSSACPLQQSCARLTQYWQPQVKTTSH